ncbi:GntR family transcriptional regulator [Aeromicrobium yanjiei]|nr:GntR family transcriptional regulator [Aeromicrobium yanjiei]
MTTRAKGTNGREQAVQRIVNEIQEMIVGGELLPGQQIRQEQMAERFSVSRLPIREALRHLLATGLVTHQYNFGFSVARLNQAEFDQLYLMRDLLESAIIRSLPEAKPRHLERLTELNDAISVAAERADAGAVRQLNKEFHFTMFRDSPLSLVVDEVERIWGWAMPYHAVFVSDSGERSRIITEHAQMVETLGRNDVEGLVQLMMNHRAKSEARLNSLLSPHP